MTFSFKLFNWKFLKFLKWGQFRLNMRAIHTTELIKISKFKALKNILNTTGEIKARSNRDLQSLEHLLTKNQLKQTKITTLKHQLKKSNKSESNSTLKSEGISAWGLFIPNEGNSYQIRFSKFPDEGNSNQAWGQFILKWGHFIPKWGHFTKQILEITKLQTLQKNIKRTRKNRNKVKS